MLRVCPITQKAANAYVRQHHRHSRAVVGALFCIGVVNLEDGASRRVGVCFVGRPVAREFDDGTTAEITRVCTDGTANACSILYGAARRACRAMGYDRILTYTLPNEGGASLRASGFRFDGDAGKPGRDWGSRPGRAMQPIGDDLVGGKWRWLA